MPKVIEGLREALLQQSRDLLLSEGYDAVTIRGVARLCGVAAGTVYNYFPSKDMLIASVILQDWQRTQNEMEQAVTDAESITQSLSQLFTTLLHFRCIYTKAWSQYTAGGGEVTGFRDRHDQLVAYLSNLLQRLSRSLHRDPSLFSVTIAAEALLTHSTDRSALEELLPVLDKLLQ